MRANRIESTRAWYGFLVLALPLASNLVVAATSVAAPEPVPPGATKTVTGQRPDFRFQAPRGRFGVRGGWTFNRADGEIFDFLTGMLTLERSNFNAPTFAADLGWGVSDRVDLLVGVEYSRSSKRSEFRDYVDQNDIPIVQDTHLTQVPLTVSLKLYLASPGRRVGQYAWVPATVVPYIGGGGGFTYYKLEQSGDFVDFVDLIIFEDVFESSGWTAAAHAFAGVDIRLNSSLGLILEGRYQWANADLRGSFLGFAPIDLNGARAMAGVNWKF